jgi:hypothetical protein
MTVSMSIVILSVTAVVAFGAALVARRALSGLGDFEIGPWTSSLSYVATAYGVVLGFSIVFLFGEFAEARKAVGNEAAAVHAAFDEAQLFPDGSTEIEHSLICYARAVIDDDWPALQDGESSPEADLAYRHVFTTLSGISESTDGTFQPATATNLVAQVGSIATAREVRIVAAHIRTPPLLWALLVFGGLLVLVLLFVVTLRAHRFAQAGLVAAASVFTVVMLLIVVALGTPFNPGAGRLSPELIEQKLASMETISPEAAALPCELDLQP